MGRRAATALHLALILIGAVLYFLFVLPRWWVLTGAMPATLATVGRISAALPIGAAAAPVWLVLQRSLRPSAATPELALRLRAWSGALHLFAGALILLAAITEIWLRLDVGGPYLFGVYGAAAAIAVLAVTAFYLSFIAEKPPAAPKPQKSRKTKKEKKPKKPRGKKSDAAADAETEATPSDSADSDEPDAQPDSSAEASVDSTDETDETIGPGATDSPDTDSPEAEIASGEAGEIEGLPVGGTAENPPPSGGLRNERPTGKARFRLRR